MAESLKDRKLAMTLHTEKVNRLIASMAKEASGQRNWKNFFPDHRCFTTLRCDIVRGNVTAICFAKSSPCFALYASTKVVTMWQDVG